MSAISYELDFATYRSLQAVSRSTLTTLLSKSPAHAKWELDHPKEQTPDMLLGQAVHCAVLEPDVFTTRFALRDLDGRTTEGKTQAATIKANGQVPMSRVDWQSVMGMARAVLDHPVATTMMDAAKTELSLQWDDVGGIPCKARLDAWAPGQVWDLKSTQDARPSAFARTIFQMGYGIQAAFYLRGAAACGLKATEFRMVVVERDPPHGVYVYRLEDAVLQASDILIDRALETWATCQKTGVYPSYSEAVTDIGLPSWAWKDLVPEEVA